MAAPTSDDLHHRNGLAGYRHGEFSADRLARERQTTLSVCLPAHNEERTIAAVLAPLVRLQGAGVVDEVVVADSSTDRTAQLAEQAGATVVRVADLDPARGPVLGKGDAMWRALGVLRGEVVVFVDADSEQVGEHYVVGLAGPVVAGVAEFVKGHYRRPFRDEQGRVRPNGGGRVTELCAKPLLRQLYPALAAVHQPLAGEIAATRRLLTRLPFEPDYGIDVGLLIDAYAAVGLDRMAQVDLDVRQNAHQPLDRLAGMAEQVSRAVLCRAWGGPGPVDRPPLRPPRSGGDVGPPRRPD